MPTMEPSLEKKYITESKSDPNCFEPLYTAYYEPILRFIYKRVESLEDCRDIASVVFTKALMNIQKYEDQGFPFSSWLYRITINEVNLFYRHTKKSRIISLDERSLRNISDENDAINPELITALKKALMYLSEDELELIELRFFEERSFSEVADILEITENNAKVKTYRAIDKLRGVYTRIT
jgi:RNA polymerase sigma-70 factor (ECF subfamily)